MQNVSTLSALLEQSDYNTGAQLTKTSAEKRRIMSHQSATHGNSATSMQTIHRDNNGRHDYTSPISARESARNASVKNVQNSKASDTYSRKSTKENLPRTNKPTSKKGGRRQDSPPLDQKEKDTLTDAELVEHFAERMSQLPLTYGFKSSERYYVLQKSISVNDAKDRNLMTGQYETQSHPKFNIPAEPTRQNFYKTKTQRKILLPKLGPTPVTHELPSTMDGPVITSSFRSETNRFVKKNVKIPGPGTYDQVIGIPTPKQIGTYLSRGIYFRTKLA